MMRKLSRRDLFAGASALGVAAVVGATRAEAAQPHMEAALDALHNADHELKDAVVDKGGHRARAIRLVHEAIDEVERGIAWARKH